jgi:hypothetical protein
MPRQNKSISDTQYIHSIIDPTALGQPNVVYNIINPESHFVVITYWWGRGNGNRNLYQPCHPEPVPEGTKLKTYDEMIEGPGGWIATCHAAGVNHMAVEYDQFRIDTEYQLAINAKPYFIKKALELCGGRAVVYIDGDMTVNRYPAIFDLQDVDFMARNWNCDPRSKCDVEDNPGGDFYTFETSGGIMYFGPTPQAHSLLDVWIQTTELPEMEGKADDRILSLIFNNSRMYLPLNFIQLPIEYLWLTLYYDTYLSKDPVRIRNKINEEARLINPADYIFIEHPHCLTPEEVARDKSCSKTKSRQPNTYNRNVGERVGLRSGGWFYDYIFFENAHQTDAFLPYYFYVNTHDLYVDEDYDESTNETIEYGVPLFYHIPYANRYGWTKKINFNEIADKNMKGVEVLQKVLTYAPSKATVRCAAGEFSLDGPCKILKGKITTISHILYYLHKGQNVLYIPNNARPIYIQSIIEEANRGRNQLITVNVSKAKNPNNPQELYSEYILNIPNDAPIYFAANSRILKHMLFMCKTLADLPQLFNGSFIFLTRIRCKWIAEPAPAPILLEEAGGIAVPVEDAAAAAVAVPVAAAPPKIRRGNLFEPPPVARKNQEGSDLADALINPESRSERTAAVQIVAATGGGGGGGGGGANIGGRRKTRHKRIKRRALRKKLRFTAKAGNRN